MQKKCACEDIYLPELATVVRSEPMTQMERFFEFRLDSGLGLGHQPGQFAAISVLGIGEAPISISSSATRGDTFDMVVRNVGNVSRAMHGLQPGDKVGVRGPFGTHFPVETLKGRDLLFVCGGIGLVPVRSAIQHVMDHRSDYGNITILFGCRGPSERLFVDELDAWSRVSGVTVQETVDRGDATWQGNVGVITTLMPKLKLDPRKTSVIVCGPPVMYKFVLLELGKLRMAHEDIFVSLERNMKCGVGKCGHCQINGLYVCQSGPVFRYSDVSEIGEAI